MTELCSKQEETDTKIFLATKFVSTRGCNSISIQTVNYDVAVLAFYYAPMLSKPLYIKIEALPCPFLRALPGLHAFSGCDSTSAFHGIGKKVVEYSQR